MSVFFDTSVLVAAMVEDEPHHEESASALIQARGGCASTHSLLECYATLTGGRLGSQLNPHDASQMIRANVYGRLRLITLTPSEQLRLIESAGPIGARGGAVYDLLLLAAARKAGANRILTLNVRHFRVFAPDLNQIISVP